MRSLSRRLSDLRAEYRRLLVKVHAVIDSHGLPAAKEAFTKDEWRAEMKLRLSEDAWLDLHVLLQQLDMTAGLRELVEPRLKQLASDSDDFRRLQTIPGIGPVLAATILSESQGIERFSSARQFAAYCGLVPSVRSSAGKARYGRITKSGPSDLRWVFGHAVMVGQRCKQPSSAVQLCRRKKAKKRPAKLAICAGANKLARVVWAMLVRGQDYGAHLATA